MTTEKLSPELADAVAAMMAASDQRGWTRGFQAGYEAGFTAGATAQKALMEQTAPTAQVIVMDEDSAEVVRDLMDHPDG